MNNAMHRVMLSCDAATFLMTKKEYKKLSCKENLQLKMHLMGCKFCRAFNDQNAIHSGKFIQLQQEPPAAKLSPKKKIEILKKIVG